MRVSERVKLIGLVVLLVFALFASPASILAEENLQFKVDHVAGKFEKLKEKIGLFLKFDKKSKTDNYQYLVEKRLAEISYVIEKNDINSVEPTASRYSTYVGVLGNFVEMNKVGEKKDDLMKMYERHIKVLSDLQGKFKFESGWWLAIQNDINVNKLFIEKAESL